MIDKKIKLTGEVSIKNKITKYGGYILSGFLIMFFIVFMFFMYGTHLWWLWFQFNGFLDWIATVHSFEDIVNGRGWVFLALFFVFIFIRAVAVELDDYCTKRDSEQFKPEPQDWERVKPYATLAFATTNKVLYQIIKEPKPYDIEKLYFEILGYYVFLFCCKERSSLPLELRFMRSVLAVQNQRPLSKGVLDHLSRDRFKSRAGIQYEKYMRTGKKSDIALLGVLSDLISEELRLDIQKEKVFSILREITLDQYLCLSSGSSIVGSSKRHFWWEIRGYLKRFIGTVLACTAIGIYLVLIAGAILYILYQVFEYCLSAIF